MYVVLWAYTAKGYGIEEKWNVIGKIYSTMQEAWNYIDEMNAMNKGGMKYRIMRLEEIK